MDILQVHQYMKQQHTEFWNWQWKDAIWVWDENQEDREYGQDEFVMRSINLQLQQL
jgi:hypothetical protein